MEAYSTMNRESSYFDIVRRSEIKEENRRLRRLFLRYKEAELVYSIQHDQGVLAVLIHVDVDLINRDDIRKGETVHFYKAVEYFQRMGV